MSERRIVVDPVTRIEGHLRRQAVFMGFFQLARRLAESLLEAAREG